MQEAFRSGTDIHTATASQVFGVEPEQVTPLQRRHAKAVNFGIVYGISEFSLAEDIGVTRKEARQYIDNYLAHYAGVRTYMHDIVEQAKNRTAMSRPSSAAGASCRSSRAAISISAPSASALRSTRRSRGRPRGYHQARHAARRRSAQKAEKKLKGPAPSCRSTMS